MAPPRSQSASVPTWVLLTAFAVGTLALGMGAAGLGYGLFGASDDRGLVNPLIWPPRWMFWAIWLILYPTIGVAAFHLRSHRHTKQGERAWILFLLSLAVGLAWVPVVQASGSRLVMPVAMDIVSLVFGMTAFWAAFRIDRNAALWLAPSVGWGLITTALKVWRLVLNS